MLSLWKPAAFVLYVFIYFTVLDAYHHWPAATLFTALLKTLPILHLAFMVTSTSTTSEEADYSKYKKWISIGLLFSSAGDAALVWPESLFVAGIIMFALAQLCYIRAFGMKPFGSGSVAATFAVFAFSMYVVVVRDLRDSPLLQSAALGYMLLICTMIWRATASYLSNRILLNGSRFLGAIIFVVSDFMVAWDRFKGPFYLGPFWIMITYYFAQFFIAVSAVLN